MVGGSKVLHRMLVGTPFQCWTCCYHGMGSNTEQDECLWIYRDPLSVHKHCLKSPNTATKCKQSNVSARVLKIACRERCVLPSCDLQGADGAAVDVRVAFGERSSTLTGAFTALEENAVITQLNMTSASAAGETSVVELSVGRSRISSRRGGWLGGRHPDRGHLFGRGILSDGRQILSRVATPW